MGDIVVEVWIFYVLGLVIIVKVMGCKFDILEWVIDVMLGFNKLVELVDDLKDCLIYFCIQWDMFCLVFGCDLLLLGVDMMVDGYDCDGVFYMCILQGEWVKSLEECVIVDWLFYNGVVYDYEWCYEFDIVIDIYCQYCLDFYYLDVWLYYEYFVLDVDGQLLQYFVDYSEGMYWKCQQYMVCGIVLVEMILFGLCSGQVL